MKACQRASVSIVDMHVHTDKTLETGDETRRRSQMAPHMHSPLALVLDA